MELNREKLDAWGIPTMKISHRWRENEMALFKDAQVTAEEMLEAAGAKDVTLRSTPSAPGEGIHEMGSARMGKDPKTSVLNGFCQSHQVPNLFVVDGSCYASSGYVNPTLTMLAISLRASEYIIDQHKKGNLRLRKQRS